MIKHAEPEITPGVPAAEWSLSAEGRAQCPALATRLRSFNPASMLSSAEPKALETARLVGADLVVGVEAVAGLHEHDRRNVGLLPEGEFRAAVAHFVARPTELVLGHETAARTLERFSRAIDDIIARHWSGDLVIVTHGTVISLFVAARMGWAPYPLWRRLGLPSYVVLSLPALDLVGSSKRSWCLRVIWFHATLRRKVEDGLSAQRRRAQQCSRSRPICTTRSTSSALISRGRRRGCTT